jgi:hypothetical protein
MMTLQEVRDAMTNKQAVTYNGELAKILQVEPEIQVSVPSSRSPITVTADQLTAR